MSVEGWVFLIVYILTIILVFIGRNWIKAKIEQSVRAGFERQLESVRSELRRSEEELKSELRQKETQLAALRDGVLGGRTQRQALVDKRRLDAIDRLWASFTALAPFTMVSAFMARINFDAAAKEAPRNPNAQRFFQTLSGGDQTANLAKLAQNPGKSEQPFVSPLAWAYFSAYQTVVLGAYMRAKVLEFGLENADKLLNDEPTKNVLKAALPYYSKFIDEHDVGSYHFLLEDLEKHLLTELQKMIRGEDQDAASLEQAARIMEMVDKATAQQAEQRAEAVGLA